MCEMIVSTQFLQDERAKKTIQAQITKNKCEFC